LLVVIAQQPSQLFLLLRTFDATRPFAQDLLGSTQ
jgi:hypothetical protein